ncbi:uncharacterized protein [Littorina saxatilis]|uniref:Uncharacterized protein n=1 Tax=Littorina saxatilis TaxID=31220 RepID=A0AAN9C2Z8_9CAEN
MILPFERMDIRTLVLTSGIILLNLTNIGGSLYRCMIPLQHCLGNFLPIGYAMQRVDIPTAITHLNQQCPNIESVNTCLAQYDCRHLPARRRVEAYRWFFNWMCQNTHVFEANAECWDFPFESDVTSCGEHYIAGEMGSRLHMANHPCPYVQQLVVCVREKMLKRPECSETATELYVNIIIQSSRAFSACPR